MSQLPLQISMNSKKQHIRLWYECLQICYSQKQFSDNLKKSKSFYEEWGDIKNTKFDNWWKEYKILFDDLYIRETTKVSKNPNTLTLNIPLTENVSTIMKEVKKIVENKQIEKLKEKGIDLKNKKSTKLELSKYSFTQSEIKGVFHYINLEIYKIYIKLNKPPINRNFLIEIRKKFDSRSRSQLRKSILNLPTMDMFEKRYKTNVDLDDNIRSIRRGIKSVEKTLLNVSNGKFP